MKNKTVLLMTGRSFNAARSRKPVIKLLLENGCNVLVATNSEAIYDKEIKETGAEFIDVPFYRHGISVLRDLRVILQIRTLIKKQKNILVHAFNPKPIFVAGLVAYLVKIEIFCVTITGLGAISDQGIKSGILKLAYKIALYKADLIILENKSDLDFILRNKIAKRNKCKVQIASGVDTSIYKAVQAIKINTPIKFAFASRLVWNKGIKELLIVAKRLQAKYGEEIEFNIAGDIEEEHPNGVPRSYIEDAHNKGYINYHGRILANEIPIFLEQCDIVILPSYREGFSKILMEGAAAGKALISTDIPGCREIVIHEITGLLVNPRDDKALYDACNKLINSPSDIINYGEASRERAIQEFDISVTAPKTLACYNEIGFLESGNN